MMLELRGSESLAVRVMLVASAGAKVREEAMCEGTFLDAMVN